MHYRPYIKETKMNKTLGIIIAAMIIIGGGIYISQNQSSQKTAIMIDDEGIMQKDEKIAKKDESIMQKQGAYKDYSPATLAEATKDGRKAVLFFYAPWCPYCRAADSAFKGNLDKIPAGVTVLKTDYDKENELKKKYSVTYQHTFVQVDANGNLVTKWNSGDVDLLNKNIK